MPNNRKLLFVAAGVTSALLVAVGLTDSAKASSERSQSVSTQLRQVKVLKLKLRKSASVVRFWNNKGRWALFAGTKHCRQLSSSKNGRVCNMARKSLKFHSNRLKTTELKLKRLAEPRDTGYLLPGEARRLGKKMAEQKGWSGEQWNCLDKLWGSLESGWETRKWNRHGSGAYGIPQALPGYKMASAGENWRDSAYVQIKWGLGYIEGRYGTPCRAISYHYANNSY